MELIGKRVKEKSDYSEIEAKGTIVSFNEKYDNHYKIVWDNEGVSPEYAPSHLTEIIILHYLDFID